MAPRKPSETGCKVCGSPDVYSRGLCQMHYRRFQSRQKEIAAEGGPQAAEEFEAKCLADGWVLPKTKGGRKKDEDPFDVIAAKMVAEMRQDYDAAIERDKAEQQAAKPPATKPAGGRKKRGA